MAQPSEKRRILVAMSGGVDSSVAAALLAEQGHEVIGVFMRNGIQAEPSRAHRQGCCGVEDSLDARRVADRLDIPFYALDYEDAFEGLIADFAGAYAEGRTPNPCIECNRRFKMGSLGVLARRLEADAVATGHYASLVERDGRFAVRAGLDRGKDQSYVLFSLEQEALQHTLLPLGTMAKAEVREHARRRDLPVAEKAESMEICFVPTGDYRDVVRARRPEAFEPGPIVNREGEVIGHHEGTGSFTIGQRRGLPGGQGEPIYVQDVRPESRTVVVGPRAEAESTRCIIERLTFQAHGPAKAGTEIRGRIKIRSQHEPVAARVVLLEGDRAEVVMDRAQHAVAPGQAAVLYDAEDVVLMGGWIARAAGHEV